MADLDPRVRERLEQVFNIGIPFNETVGIRVGSIEHGRATMSLEFRPELIGDKIKNILHGGVVSTLIDTVGGLAAFTVLEYPRELTVNTVDMRVDYLRPAGGQSFTGVGQVIRKGSRICVARVEVHNDQDLLVAHGVASYSIMSADPNKPAAEQMRASMTGLVDGNE